jgi:hypothetical protein
MDAAKTVPTTDIHVDDEKTSVESLLQRVFDISEDFVFPKDVDVANCFEEEEQDNVFRLVKFLSGGPVYHETIYDMFVGPKNLAKLYYKHCSLMNTAADKLKVSYKTFVETLKKPEIKHYSYTVFGTFANTSGYYKYAHCTIRNPVHILLALVQRNDTSLVLLDDDNVFEGIDLKEKVGSHFQYHRKTIPLSQMNLTLNMWNNYKNIHKDNELFSLVREYAKNGKKQSYKLLVNHTNKDLQLNFLWKESFLKLSPQLVQKNNQVYLSLNEGDDPVLITSNTDIFENLLKTKWKSLLQQFRLQTDTQENIIKGIISLYNDFASKLPNLNTPKEKANCAFVMYICKVALSACFDSITIRIPKDSVVVHVGKNDVAQNTWIDGYRFVFDE